MAPKTYGDEHDEPEAAYHESSDDDFDPDSAPADDAPSSSDEDEAAPAPKGKRKAAVVDGLDSGDEFTIEAARKKARQRKKGGRGDEQDLLLSEDEGGEGGLVKTRAQRAGERKERRPLARTEGATVDVEALWAQMTSAPLRPAPPPPPAPLQAASTAHDAAPAVAQTADAPVEEEVVAVAKTFVFAGQTTTEEKQVPRSALDKYTADGWKPATAVTHPDRPSATAAKPSDSHLRRPLKRPSRFDPNPSGYVRALPPEHQLTWPRAAPSTAPPPDTALDGPKKPEKATKLNVVDKSRMDWSGFVSKEGIADELQEHGKSKDNYMSRRDFLAGVEARMEEEGRKGRLANATALT